VTRSEVTGALIDTILDRSVIAGYTNVGYRIRSRTIWRAGVWRSGVWRADSAGCSSVSGSLPRMDSKVVLVTGASSGIGLAACEGLAHLGAGVRMLVRDRERGERARAQTIERTGNEDVRVLVGDLSDLRSVRELAERFIAGSQEGRLDVLVNNAGALPRERTLAPDGVELTFATNVLGPFLLTKLLTGLLCDSDSAPARIVDVSSGGMYTRRLHGEDLQMADERYDGPTAYARSKRAQVVLSGLWAERLRGRGVTVNAMHPGWVDTPGLRSSLPRFYACTKRLLRTPDEGADTIVWLAAAPEVASDSGCFWHDRRKRPTYPLPLTRETATERERLWAECERLSSGKRALRPEDLPDFAQRDLPDFPGRSE
jgi:dehydrogenase/reductase SDR family member 12